MDVTGTPLVPGNFGRDCPGNGENTPSECCCEECDFMLCCILEDWMQRCGGCLHQDCPRKK